MLREKSGNKTNRDLTLRYQNPFLIKLNSKIILLWEKDSGENSNVGDPNF